MIESLPFPVFENSTCTDPSVRRNKYHHALRINAAAFIRTPARMLIV